MAFHYSKILYSTHSSSLHMRAREYELVIGLNTLVLVTLD